MASPYAQVADALKTIIDTEFAAEGWTAIHDNLHESVGMEGTRIGIAPDEESAINGVRNDIAVTVKFYRRWDPDVEPSKKVDPRPITELAERFRVAVRNANAGGTSKFWYFNVERIRYPNDPVGNKSRFEVDITAFGSNSALVETTG